MYIVKYSRYHNEYEDEFDTYREAKSFIDTQEDYGEIYARYLIRPDGKTIDLKKEFEETMGFRKT